MNQMHRPENNTLPYFRAILYYNGVLPRQFETTGSIVVVSGLPKKSTSSPSPAPPRDFSCRGRNMFEVVALVFQGIECLDFNLPAGTPTAHYFFACVGCQSKVGDPAKILDNSAPFHFFNHPCRVDFEVFQHIDPVARVGFVQRGVILKAKFMLDSR